MVNAETKLSTIRISNDGNTILLKATIGKLIFDGYKRAYNIQDDDDEEVLSILDSVKVGDQFDINSIESIESFTSPPSRYTDASLVRKLEELDIGRPSTYASILVTIVNRGSVLKNGKAFLLNARGRVVNVFLCNYFEKFLEMSKEMSLRLFYVFFIGCVNYYQ